jgi:hypothetical protein
MSTFSPALVHRASINTVQEHMTIPLLTHNLATFVLILGLIVLSCALFFYLQ